MYCAITVLRAGHSLDGVGFLIDLAFSVLFRVMHFVPLCMMESVDFYQCH